ncbi:potassium channel family protein [Halorientalis salina]|uniref:potassium channel family protein n=1 Tax=Halorientalis salina TaxID=2932266 RepID=UPI0010AD3A11|nr:potassium channel family protein [Halorientalis salina]
MNVVPLLVGAVLLGVTVTDLLWTTLWVEGGAGPLTSRLMRGTWRALRAVSGRSQRILTVSGPIVLVLGLLVWIALFWVGWTLVFAGIENAIIGTGEPGPISWTERVYFVGSSLFTLGNGDFIPTDGIWQILTVLTTASGMLFITLIVSYVISVLDAVTQKRAFASDVSGLGQDGTTIVRTAWDGETFSGLELPLNSIAADVNELTTNHYAYPILHYFYTERRDYVTVLSIVALDEALTLLRFGVPEAERPSTVVIHSARASVGNYIDAVTSPFAHTAEQSPPPPDLDRLRKDDIPTVSDETFVESLTEITERRRQLRGIVDGDARDWPSGQDD